MEASRLRKRLKEYYAAEGAGHMIQIRLSRTGYTPDFVNLEAEFISHRNETFSGEDEPPAESALLVPLEGPANPPQRSGGSRPLRRFLPAAAMIFVFLGVSAVLWLNNTHNVKARIAEPGAGAGWAASVPDSALSDGLRILAGSTRPQFVDSLGQPWLSDRYYKGGEAIDVPADDILGVTDPVPYRTARQGGFRYDIPLKPGVYELRLLFMETSWGKGNRTLSGEATRIFNVKLNGQVLLADLDVLSDAGFFHLPADRIFKDVTPAPDGFLHLEFAPQPWGKQPALLSGIEILPGTPGRMRPVRIAAGGASYWDRAGRLWGADRYFVNGRTMFMSNAPIRDTTDPELYRYQRFGHFYYSIPVAPGGRYQVTLKFAEVFYGKDTQNPDGLGQRVFNVFCNGVALLRNFEVLKAAGQSNRAVDEVFHGLTPNALGRIELSFEPVKDYAEIQAIEVVDESRQK